MKPALILILLAGLTIRYAPALAQGDPPSPRTAMNRVRLMLIRGIHADATGSEEILTIRLSNEGKTTLSFPEPGHLCGDSLNGFVMVYKRILSPSRHDEVGSGCIVDRVARTDILVETKKWKTLAPGGVYEITVPLRSMLLNADRRYELTAKYYPPHVTSGELSVLAANGITLPRQTIESSPIIVQPQDQ
jgi:hypothetical protein